MTCIYTMRVMNKTQRCQHCMQEFEARREWQKFCSRNCHDTWWNAMKKVKRNYADKL